MAKRNATSELNHDNWEEEDEQEEAGLGLAHVWRVCSRTGQERLRLGH